MKIINLINIRLINCADSHAQMFYSWSYYFTEKKEDISDIYSQQPDDGFPRHISLQLKMSHFWKKLNHETKTR